MMTRGCPWNFSYTHDAAGWLVGVTQLALQERSEYGCDFTGMIWLQIPQIGSEHGYSETRFLSELFKFYYFGFIIFDRLDS